ncbi:hypothetical protein [uncultured Thiocystis sp.]|uniref:hypothetical protein n=1 Tax=uncultured Thiocystis sp. TaxID=1202134 RepID=UPI0025F26D0D|nr:hypothetical protein [uncultured Thiocystis sp.]
MAELAPDLEYLDQVLSPLVTAAHEDRAIAEVDAMATFTDPWRGRLTVLRVYIAICLEYARTNDDPFSVKLAEYRAEYDPVLTDARAAVTKSAMTTGLFSIPLGRA